MLPNRRRRGLNALFVHAAVLIVIFGVFCLVQLVWQLNSLADVGLSQIEELRAGPTSECGWRSAKESAVLRGLNLSSSTLKGRGT